MKAELQQAILGELEKLTEIHPGGITIEDLRDCTQFSESNGWVLLRLWKDGTSSIALAKYDGSIAKEFDIGRWSHGMQAFAAAYFSRKLLSSTLEILV